MHLQGIIISLLLLFLNKFGDCIREVTVDKTISKPRGSTVVLSCPIDVSTCGELHSVNWFKGEKRVAVALGNGTNIASDYRDRLDVEHSSKGPETKITIRNLDVKDEDIYTCDTTFYVPQENCDASRGYRISLLIRVAPSDTYILYNNEKIVDKKLIGPVQEGHELRAFCVVEHTRPKPKISWHRGDMILPSQGNYSKEENGIFLHNSEELTFVLSREDLNNDIECRVESDALDKVITYTLELDLQVRPTKIELTGVESHTVEKSEVILKCKVSGARPYANITWSNSSVIIDGDDNNDRIKIHEEIISEKDGSHTTISQLQFTATRFENDVDFRCDADNIVMQKNREKPLHSEINLVVLFPPVVTVNPDHLTVNEGDRVLLNCEYIANPASLNNVTWLRDGIPINISSSSSSRFEGGNPENVALSILKAKRNDVGNYTCRLTNSIGNTTSDTQIDLDVQYVPTVQVQMLPVDQVRENDETNVTLICNVIDGNPPNLLKVRWYANSSLLKELPDCSTTSGDDLCHVDPSKLLLESIGRGFFFNYSCEGYNSVGWGPRSDDKELVVQYEPGPAVIQQDPLLVIKKKSVTLTCRVEDLGFPPATINSYSWFRNGQAISNVKRATYTMELVSTNNRGNYSCYAHNPGGIGISGTHYLNIIAPPNFIKALGQYTGVVYSSKNMSLTCRVECYPKCSITWTKDGIKIDPNSTNLYYIEEKYMPAEENNGDFESALSTLHFNLSAWPNNQFDKLRDNGNYSCHSSGNSAGNGVESATYLSIEYPPENTTVPVELNVTENSFPEEFECLAIGNPEPKYVWRYKGEDIIFDKKFKFQNPVTRNDSGHYECISYNKHGSHSSQLYMNVQYKPSCVITRKVYEEDTLICSGDGNPEDYNYKWYQKTENDTIELEEDRQKRVGKTSHYILDDDLSITKTYRCMVINSIGAGAYCYLEVAGQLAWWQKWDRTTLIILIASIAAVLLAVIIICCIIICICRRRRRQEKYHTDISISATQSVLSYQASSPLPASTLQMSSEVPKSPPKWPLRPGVMVHVKGDTKQNLCANRLITNNSANTVQTVATIEVQATELTTSMTNTILPSSLTQCENKNSDENKNSGGNENRKDCENSGKNLSNEKSRRPLISARVSPNNVKDITQTAISEMDTSHNNNNERPPTLPRRNIMTSKNSTNKSDHSGNSVVELLPRRKRGVRRIIQSDDDDEDDDSAVGITAIGEESTVQNGLFERIFGEIFSRRDENGNRNSFSSSIYLRNIFGISRIFGGRKQLERNDSNKSNSFINEHQIKGIRCSGNVVTYKKPPTASKQLTSKNGSNSNNSNAQLQTSERAPQNEPDSTKKIHGKSSTLGDPLTEPGEYENLPFHGLQTAPNKFTTPINFNNTNVVRVAPRPKLTDNNLQQQQHQLQYQLQQDALKQATYSIPSHHHNTLISSSNTLRNDSHDGVGVNSKPSSNHYNLNDCFPTSYTAYYHEQQQRQYCASNFQSGKYYTDYPYTVQNITSNHTNIDGTNNPFVVGNGKKFNTDSGCRTGSHRKKILESDSTKKFYSLKPLSQKKGLHLCSMKSSFGNLTSNNKCKRHHSFTGGSTGDVISIDNYPIPQDTQSIKMNFYEPPAYENLTDSIQIHEHNPVTPPSSHHSTSTPQPTSQIITHHSHHNKKHHQHQHQQMKDGEIVSSNLTEKERLSIYRSDSGISNSSYECITPVPAPRQVIHKAKSSTSKSKSSTPQYMNIASSGGGGNSTTPTPTPTTPSNLSLPPLSSIATPSNACPLRRHHNQKCNCNSDNGNSCNIHCNANGDNQTNNNANKDMQQQQHHYHHQQQQQYRQDELMQHHHQNHNTNHHQSSAVSQNSSRRRKLSSASLISLEHTSNTNPFLTTISSSSSGFTSGGGNNGGGIGICNNGGGGGASSSSSSTTSRYKQQVLVPKELFTLPLSSPPSPKTVPNVISTFNTNTSNAYSYNSNYRTDTINNTDDGSHNIGATITNRKQKSRGYTVRPAKFPLRKHHSFHFQLSQTVAGVKMKKKSNNPIQNSGPLIFKPFLNEKSAFKPISPAKCSTNYATNTTQNTNTFCANLYINNNDEIIAPRICGTSLKRHMSNVETYDGSRYSTKSTTLSSLSSSGVCPPAPASVNNVRTNKIRNRDENYSEDEIPMMISRHHDEDGQSTTTTTSSSSTMVPRRLNFNEINTSTSSTKLKRCSINDDISPTTDDFDDLTVNSDSEQIRRKSRLFKTIQYRSNNKYYSNDDDTYDDDDMMIPDDDTSKSNLRSNKYVTLTFNEANI